MVSIDNSKEIPFKQDDTSLKGRKKEALQASVLLSELNYSGLKRFCPHNIRYGPFHICYCLLLYLHKHTEVTSSSIVGN